MNGRQHLAIGVADIISPSYFPVIAASGLGLFADQGLDVRIELAYPLADAMSALRAGELDYVAGAAHGPLYDPAGFTDCRLVCALAHGMYWFLVLRADLAGERGDLHALRGRRIGAAPGPREGLKAMLLDVDSVLARDVDLVAVPGSGPSVSFGLSAADALARGEIDGFWANGMGAAIATADRTGRVVLDARRDLVNGRDPAYTFAALIAARSTPASAAATEAPRVRAAVVAAQDALRRDPGLAARAARGWFPPREQELISELVARDSDYYHAIITAPMTRAIATVGRLTGLPGVASG